MVCLSEALASIAAQFETVVVADSARLASTPRKPRFEVVTSARKVNTCNPVRHMNSTVDFILPGRLVESLSTCIRRLVHE